MGYFAQPTESGAAPGRATPLSTDRIAAALDSQSWNYETDEDGDIRGSWGGHVFYFLRMGRDNEIFMVRGRWEARPPSDLAPRLLEWLNVWHKEHLFPKAVVVDFADDGNCRVFTEVTIDCEHGITDEQLLLHIRAGLESSLNLFEEIDKAFPGLQETEDD